MLPCNLFSTQNEFVDGYNHENILSEMFSNGFHLKQLLQAI